MNLFFLDKDIERACKYHCDKHVVKMILESTQMLSTVLIDRGYGQFAPYKPTHRNHPCTVWANHKPVNYNFLLDFAKGLCTEYTYRYDKVHKSEHYLNDMPYIKRNTNFKITTPAMAMPVFYKEKNVVQAYRRYYLIDKTLFATYKRRTPPSWYRKCLTWHYDSKTEKWSPDYEDYIRILDRILSTKI